SGPTNTARGRHDGRGRCGTSTWYIEDFCLLGDREGRNQGVAGRQATQGAVHTAAAPLGSGGRLMSTITTRVLTKRINRRLAAEGRAMGWPPSKLCKSRARELFDLGEWHVVDTDRNVVIDHHFDPEQLGRELGVMGASEVLA